MGELPDVEGWARVYESNATRLTRLATVLVGAEDAHDLVADAIVRAVTSPSWSSVSSPSAYLSRTLVNLAASQHQSRVRRERRERTAAHAAPSAVDDVEHTGVLADVRDTLELLTPGERAVVYLHYWEDRTLNESARELGVSVGTVRQQLHRAKRKLRDALDPQGDS